MSFAIPQTPQRPLPGAYQITPAQRQSGSGQPNQSSSGPPQTFSSQQNGSQGQALAAQRPPEDLKPVERASRTISDALLREAQYPELDAYITRTCPSSSHPFSLLMNF